MARDTPVTQVMTPDVISVRPDMTIEEAVAAFAQRGISGAPVTDDDGRLVGLLDDTDLLVSEARLHSPTTVESLGAYFASSQAPEHVAGEGRSIPAPLGSTGSGVPSRPSRRADAAVAAVPVDGNGCRP